MGCYDVCLFWRVVVDALGSAGAGRVAVVVLLIVFVGYCGLLWVLVNAPL